MQLPQKTKEIFNKYLRPRTVGASIITGAADNDPSGITTYAQIGAATGFSLLWLLALSTVLLYTLEEMAGRVAIVTKQGLNSLVSQKFGKKTAILTSIIIMLCNTATIGANIVAISTVISLLLPISNRLLIIPITILLAYLLVSKSYHKVRIYLLFLTPLFLVYVVAGFFAQPDWTNLFQNIINPSILNSANYWILAAALLGTTLSPYLIYWQGIQELEEQKTIDELDQENKGVAIGMIYTNLIAFFIIIATAAALFPTPIQTLKEAALGLQFIAGTGFTTYLLFSFGIIISGMLSIPVLASTASYTMADTFGLISGLDKKYSEAKSFYIILLSSLAIGTFIALSGINPINLLIYTQVLNSLLMPILVFILLKISNDTMIMGSYKNSFTKNFFGWLIFASFIIVNILMLASL